MTQAVLLVVALMLAGCVEDDEQASIPAGTTGCFTVMERPDIKEAFSKLPNKLNHRQVNGFAQFNGSGFCRITVPPIDGNDDWDSIGTWLHEIRHCAYGNYHQ
jgi:hypothetical protein